MPRTRLDESGLKKPKKVTPKDYVPMLGETPDSGVAFHQPSLTPAYVDQGGSAGGQSPTDKYYEDLYKYRLRGSKIEETGAPSATTATFTPSSPGSNWWKNLTYQGGGEGEILASSVNALLPTFAEDDAVNVAKWLGDNFKDFEGYKGATAEKSDKSASMYRNEMFSKARAKNALSNLESMRAASGRTESDMGPGYAFLKKTIALLDKYGSDGQNGMSRSSFSSMQNEFNALLSGVDDTYAEIGRSFLNPTQDSNPLMQSITAGGRNTFGIPNTKLFT